METTVATYKGYRWGESNALEDEELIQPYPQIKLEDSQRATSNHVVNLLRVKQAFCESSGIGQHLRDVLDKRIDSDFGDGDRDCLSQFEFKLPYTKRITPLVDAAVISQRLRERFQVLQKWEGRVTSVDHDSGEFTAFLTDKTNPEEPEEQVVLDIDELADNDKERLKPGSLFYWTVGHRFSASGGKTKESEIRLRRLRGFSDTTILSACKYAREMSDLFESVDTSIKPLKVDFIDSSALTKTYLKTHGS